jgi:hypothetical protein
MDRRLRTQLPGPSSALTGRRAFPMPAGSGAVAQGVGLTRRRVPLLGWRAARVHRSSITVPPRRTDTADAGAGSVHPRPEQAERSCPYGSCRRRRKEVSLPIIAQSASLH